jgi:hypothetical protein
MGSGQSETSIRRWMRFTQSDHCADRCCLAWRQKRVGVLQRTRARANNLAVRCSADSGTCASAHRGKDERVAKAVAFIQQSHAHHIFSLDLHVAAAPCRLSQIEASDITLFLHKNTNRRSVKIKYDPKVRTSTQLLAEKVLITMSHNARENVSRAPTNETTKERKSLDTLDPRNTDDRSAVMGLDHVTSKAQ